MTTATRRTTSRKRSDSGPGTRDKILRAAERLFGHEGFDRVTLRQIARASDQRNVAAVQYHFGSKQGLLSAIVEAHREQIDARRSELLAEIEARPQTEELAALLDILIMPLIEKLDSPSGRAYLRIQAEGLSHDTMRPATRTLVRRIGQQLGEHLGTGPGRADPTDADPYRNRFAVLLLFHALADRAALEERSQATRADRPAFADALSRSLHALFRA